MLQTGQPMTALAALIGPLRLSFAERAELFGVYVPWALKCHRSCRHLLSVHYERYLELDIQHVRSLLCLVEPPLPRSPLK
jgi:ubiquinone biosynthesis protein COQ4